MWLLKKFRHPIIIFKNRFNAIPKPLKTLLIISIITSPAIDYSLKKYFLEYLLIQAVGSTLINLGYSYFAGFILYYVAVFEPLERKKIAVFRTINNSIAEINSLATSVIESVCREDESEFIYDIKTLEFIDFERACSIINRHQACEIKGSFRRSQHENWHIGLEYVSNEINRQINLISNFNDCIDADLLGMIYGVKDELKRVLAFKKDNRYSPEGLIYVARSLFFVFKSASKIQSLFHEEYKIYFYEYHYGMRRLNKEFDILGSINRNRNRNREIVVTHRRD